MIGWHLPTLGGAETSASWGVDAYRLGLTKPEAVGGGCKFRAQRAPHRLPQLEDRPEMKRWRRPVLLIAILSIASGVAQRGPSALAAEGQMRLQATPPAQRITRSPISVR